MFRGAAVVLLLCAGLLTAGCGDDSSGSDLASISASVAAEERSEPKVEPTDDPPPQRLVKRDLIEGTGAEAEPGDELTINYLGAIYKTGVPYTTTWNASSPLSFILGNGEVFRGWDLGLEGMKVGGRRELIIPPELHYGRGKFAHGDPYAPLVFVIDLLEVVN